MFDDATIELECPNCGVKATKTLGWIRTHKDMACAGCKETIKLDSTQLDKEMRGAERELEKFQRQVNKTLRIDL